MKKTILILCIVGAVAFCSPKVSAAAISNSNTQASVSESQERTAGLITRCNLSVVSSGKNLLINGKTIANASMQTIGYKNVVVEYSSNGTNWYEEKDLGDLLKSNSSSYYLNSYTVPVKGGTTTVFPVHIMLRKKGCSANHKARIMCLAVFGCRNGFYKC